MLICTNKMFNVRTCEWYTVIVMAAACRDRRIYQDFAWTLSYDFARIISMQSPGKLPSSKSMDTYERSISVLLSPSWPLLLYAHVTKLRVEKTDSPFISILILTRRKFSCRLHWNKSCKIVIKRPSAKSWTFTDYKIKIHGLGNSRV